jgi:hypothetical protein
VDHLCRRQGRSIQRFRSHLQVVLNRKPAGSTHQSSNQLVKELLMDKWTIISNSKVVRISASATTLVAVATIAGAGWKWY